MLLIELDRAIQNIFSNYTDNNRVIPCLSKEKWIGCTEDSKYPAISYKRINRVHDRGRYINESELSFSPSDNSFVEKRPYQTVNFLYQVELNAKSAYDIELLESIVNDAVNIPYDSIKVSESFQSEKTISIPIFMTDYSNLDEVDDNNNIDYRRIYVFEIKTTIDTDVTKGNGFVSTQPLKISSYPK